MPILPIRRSRVDRTEIRISGFGGQGIVLMGYITGKAAAIYDNKNATLTQSYGPEARGGACSAQVIVATEKINYPVLVAPDILITMSQAAYNTFRPGLKPGGILLYDSGLVKLNPDDTTNIYPIPAKDIAKNLGRQIIANMVMLGFLVAIGKVVNKEAMEQAITASVPAEMQELNLEAFRRGYNYKPS